MFHYYNRLKSSERPVENILISGEYGDPRYKPTKYTTETRSFFRFTTKDHKDVAFTYVVHKKGWLPDPLTHIPPADRVRDGYLGIVFPQFAKYIDNEKLKQRKLEARMGSKK